MGHTLEIRDGVLHITVVGPWPPEQVYRVQAEAAARVREGGVRGLLLDCRRAKVQATPLDIFEVTTSHGAVFPPDLRHALVLREEQMPACDERFYENVAANRGMMHRVFRSTRDARAWLLAPEEA